MRNGLGEPQKDKGQKQSRIAEQADNITLCGF